MTSRPGFNGAATVPFLRSTPGRIVPFSGIVCAVGMSSQSPMSKLVDYFFLVVNLGNVRFLTRNVFASTSRGLAGWRLGLTQHRGGEVTRVLGACSASRKFSKHTQGLQTLRLRLGEQKGVKMWLSVRGTRLGLRHSSQQNQDTHPSLACYPPHTFTQPYSPSTATITTIAITLSTAPLPPPSPPDALADSRVFWWTRDVITRMHEARHTRGYLAALVLHEAIDNPDTVADEYLQRRNVLESLGLRRPYDSVSLGGSGWRSWVCLLPSAPRPAPPRPACPVVGLNSGVKVGVGSSGFLSPPYLSPVPHPTCAVYDERRAAAKDCLYIWTHSRKYQKIGLDIRTHSRKYQKIGLDIRTHSRIYQKIGLDIRTHSRIYQKIGRWQRRWFVLYDDGELTYCLDDHIGGRNDKAFEIAGTNDYHYIHVPEMIAVNRCISKTQHENYEQLLTCKNV
ncbi:hypothetical protein GWK47_022418 [Chionoecetes opilio]|uniref:PH domain-containing protein n=1 Tax=Chionoecetes opilio TaxID=41210 RepID=A0A8J4XN73_CHIOP|nr:hypothetical protein GWK47_022418 [Chionoecetes opilio]